MMRRRSLLLMAFLLPVACATSRPAPEAPVSAPAEAEGIPWERSEVADWSTPPTPGPEPAFEPPRPETFRLENGVRVVLVENRRLPLVSMLLAVEGAGSASDPKGLAGLAAYTADLLDEGVEGLDALEIAATLEGLGATLDVGAGIDGAGVSLSSLSRTFPEALRLATRIVTAPSMARKDALRVHKDRMTELALRPDQPREVARLALEGTLYGRESAYGHPVSGYPETLRRAGLTDARAFHRRFWRPEQMTLIVAGDVTRETLERQLAESLGAWRPRAVTGAPRPAAAPAERPSRLVLVDRPGAPQSDFRVGLVGLPRTDPRFYAFEVLNTALGGGFTSRLNHRLREQLGFTYGAGSAMDWRLQPGPFVIGSSIFTPRTGEAADEILRIVRGLADGELPAAELEKARENLVRALPARFETNRDLVAAYADLVKHGLPLDWYAGYAERIREVTAADVQRVAAEVLPADGLVFVVVGDVDAVRPELEALLGAPVLVDVEGRPIPTR